MYEIRHSTDQGFYYLLEIDNQGNEKLIAEDTSLPRLKDHDLIKNKSLEPVEDKVKG